MKIWIISLISPCLFWSMNIQQAQVYYEVVAALPTADIGTINENCTYSIKDPIVLRTIHTAARSLRNMIQGEDKNGVIDGLKWISYKGAVNKNSAINLVTTNGLKAQTILYMLREMKQTGCIKWVTFKAIRGTFDSRTQYALVTTQSDNLNLRRTPSMNGTVLTSMPNGSRVVVKQIGRQDIIDGRTGNWMNVEFIDVGDNQTYSGWAWSYFLKLQ